MERRTRPTAVAGTFYPADPARLRDRVDGLLLAADPPPAPPPRALIVPHAGYRYSGGVAAAAYAHLRATRPEAAPVLAIGPAHFVPFEGLALPAAEAVASPLGTIPLDEPLQQRLRAFPQVAELGDAHRPEHSLEVQFPFLQVVLEDPRLALLTVGRAVPVAVAGPIAAVLADPDALVVVSSDLSHGHDAATAARLDAGTAEAIEALQPDRLRPDAACGRTAVAGLLLAAADLGLRPVRLDLRTSADTAGSPERVVGYGAWTFG